MLISMLILSIQLNSIYDFEIIENKTIVQNQPSQIVLKVDKEVEEEIVLIKEKNIKKQKEKIKVNIQKKVFDNKTKLPFVISNLPANEINQKLKGTYLEGYGNVLYDIEQTLGVNFRFIYAIGALESGYGKKCIEPNNLFSIKNKDNYNEYLKFKDKVEPLYHVANIFQHSMYKNKDIYTIAKHYCPPNEKNKKADIDWANDVLYIMGEI